MRIAAQQTSTQNNRYCSSNPAVPYTLGRLDATESDVCRLQIVLIEPLATMAAVEEFLWPRVFRTDDGAAARVAGEQAARSNVRTFSWSGLTMGLGPGSQLRDRCAFDCQE